MRGIANEAARLPQGIRRGQAPRFCLESRSTSNLMAVVRRKAARAAFAGYARDDLL